MTRNSPESGQERLRNLWDHRVVTFPPGTIPVMGAIGKTLVLLGVIMVGVGLLFLALERVGVRQWRLPGDIAIERDGFHFYFPLGTSILVSIVLSLILTFLAWLATRGGR